MGSVAVMCSDSVVDFGAISIVCLLTQLPYLLSSIRIYFLACLFLPE